MQICSFRCEHSKNHISLKYGKPICKVTHCAGHMSVWVLLVLNQCNINCLPPISDVLLSFHPATESSVTENSIGD